MAAARSVTHVETNAAEGDVVSLNLVTDNAAGAGYFSVWPTAAGEGNTMAGTPEFSNLNYAPGQIIANSVEVKAGVDGKVSIYTNQDAP